jgi:hypothetical protein
VIATGNDTFVKSKACANYISVGNDLAAQMTQFPGLAAERTRRISDLVQRLVLISTFQHDELMLVFSTGVSKGKTEVFQVSWTVFIYAASLLLLLYNSWLGCMWM